MEDSDPSASLIIETMLHEMGPQLKESASFRSYSRSVRLFQPRSFRLISGVSCFGPVGAGRLGPIS